MTALQRSYPPTVASYSSLLVGFDRLALALADVLQKTAVLLPDSAPFEMAESAYQAWAAMERAESVLRRYARDDQALPEADVQDYDIESPPVIESPDPWAEDES